MIDPLEYSMQQMGDKSEYESITYPIGFTVECDPPEQAANLLNFLTCGYPLAGKSLDGVTFTYTSGEHKGETYSFIGSLKTLWLRGEK